MANGSPEARLQPSLSCPMVATTPPAGSALEEPGVFRWFVLAVILASQLGLVTVLFAPSAVAQLIIQDLNITKAQFGLLMSAASATVMVCVVLASVLVDRIGAKRALALGLICLGGGSLILGSKSY